MINNKLLDITVCQSFHQCFFNFFFNDFLEMHEQYFKIDTSMLTPESTIKSQLLRLKHIDW